MRFPACLLVCALLRCGGSPAGPPALAPGMVAVPRAARHTATRLADGTVLVAGGLQGDGTATPAAERLDPADLRARATGPLSGPRAWHTATLLASGKVLIAGGTPWTGSPIALATAEVFDPGTGTFSPTRGPMAFARHSHTATLLQDGTVLLTGGDGPNPDQVWSSAELYEPATDTFSPLSAPMTTYRTLHTASLLPSGKVLIVGGTDWVENVPTAEIFDPGTHVFTALGSAPEHVYVDHCAEVLDSGEVLLVGNQGAEVFLPASGAFSAVPGPSSLRNDAALIALPGVGAAFLGGERSSPASPPTPLGTVDVFLGDQQGFGPGTDLPAPRSGLRAVLLKDGRVLVVGGTDAGQKPLETFEVLTEP